MAEIDYKELENLTSERANREFKEIPEDNEDFNNEEEGEESEEMEEAEELSGDIYLSDLIDPEQAIEIQDIVLSRLFAGIGSAVINEGYTKEDFKLEASEKRTLAKVVKGAMHKIKIEMTPLNLFFISTGIVYSTKFVEKPITGGKFFNKKKGKTADKKSKIFEDEAEVINELPTELKTVKAATDNKILKMAFKDRKKYFDSLQKLGFEIDKKKKTILVNEKSQISTDSKNSISCLLSWGYLLITN